VNIWKSDSKKTKASRLYETRCMYATRVYVLEVVELMRCLYVSHWKELSADDNVNHSTAVERWSVVWVQPVLELISSHSTSSNHRARLCDV